MMSQHKSKVLAILNRKILLLRQAVRNIPNEDSRLSIIRAIEGQLALLNYVKCEFHCQPILPKKIVKRIPVNQHVLDALKQLPRAIKHDYVITYKGEPLNAKFSLKKQFSDTCKKAEITHGRKEGITFHDIRRTVKTNMVRAGIDKVYRDTILGHSLKGMDLNYIVPTDNVLTKAMQRYTNWLNGQLENQNVDQSVEQKTIKSA